MASHRAALARLPGMGRGNRVSCLAEAGGPRRKGAELRPSSTGEEYRDGERPLPEPHLVGLGSFVQTGHTGASGWCSRRPTRHGHPASRLSWGFPCPIGPDTFADAPFLCCVPVTGRFQGAPGHAGGWGWGRATTLTCLPGPKSPSKASELLTSPGATLSSRVQWDKGASHPDRPVAPDWDGPCSAT